MSSATSERIRARLHTDLGNAERLVARHGDDLRFVSSWGPLAWDGRRWAPDTTGEFTRRAKDTARAMLAEAATLPTEDERRALAKWALASESVRAISAMMELAKTEPEIAAAPEHFDRNPFLINIANGTLDLRTQQLREHRREDLITKLAPVAYDPDATCPRWERFLLEIMDGRHELVAFLKRVIGYSLSGDTREQKFLFLHGAGSNGKGTLTRTLEALLGDYYQQADFSSFLEQRRSGASASPDIARLVGSRLVAASETGGVRRVDEGLLKSLTGQDTIPTRLLYREPFDFRPAFKLWLIANEKPTIRGTDYGIWRRLLLVPFDVTIDDSQVDHELEATLQGPELPGILTWCVEGCAEWLERGLAVPDVVRAATATYRDEQDVVASFLAEECEVTADADEAASNLLVRFNATVSRGEQLDGKRLSAALKRHGFNTVRNSRGVRWIGLRLRPRVDGVGSAGSAGSFDNSYNTHAREKLPKTATQPTQTTQPTLQLDRTIDRTAVS